MSDVENQTAGAVPARADELKANVWSLVDALVAKDEEGYESEFVELVTQVTGLIDRKLRMEGTKTDTRDFLVLSSFAEDPTPDRVADMVDLGEMSILSSSTDHPLICYLVVPDGEAPAAPRIYRHAERDEWIADLAIRVRAEGAEEPKKLRVGVVLIGVSEHF